MNDEDFIKYLGGFFDADGSIFWRTNGLIVINFSQSHKELLDYINGKYNNIFILRNRKRKENNRTEFGLTKTGKALYPVLCDLKKSSIIKNPQICKALEYLNEIDRIGMKEKRQQIGLVIKKMNNDKYNEEFINMRPYENINIPYIAGLFDGDGCICIRSNHGKYAKITQKNDTLMLELIHNMYPGSRYKKGEYSVTFEKKEVLEGFLNDILPYLVYKTQQVIDALRFINSNDYNEKQELYIKVSTAKKFDLDPIKYREELQYVFEDMEKNYTTEDLTLGKKVQELRKMRNIKSWNNNVLNGEHLNIEPELIFCENREQNEKWLYYRNKTSSLYYTGIIGRNVRILVRDKVSKKYIGIMSLGSDFYNISARDNYIKKYSDKNLSEYITSIANLNCCVPLQPFGYNTNGGKLLVKLAFSKEVSDYWMKKYNTPLLAICTLGVNGKSVLYDRLSEIKFVGYTKAKCSTIHIPIEVIDKAKILYNHLGLVNSRHGTIDMLNTLFNKVKIRSNFNTHINKKGVYFGWLYNTKFDTQNVSINSLKTVNDIFIEWKKRWAINRLNNVTKNGKLKTKIELYSENDEIFKNIKEYKLPQSRNIERIQPIQSTNTKKYIKEQRSKQPLILQRLDTNELIQLMTKKGVLETQKASDFCKEKYNKIIQRSQISKLWIGEIIPNEEVQNSEEYKTAINLQVKRVYSKPKTDTWKEAVKESNHQRKLSDDKILEVMNEKKTAYSSKELGEKYNVSRGTIENIWTGKLLPSNKEISKEYRELIDYKRTRMKKLK